MAKKTELTADIARDIARAFGVSLFDRNSYAAKDKAQANLSGRTHYVDDDTLRFFHSRISSARAIEHETIFLIVESVAADYQNRSRGFRFVAFDLNGSVINDRKGPETLHRTSAQAEKEMWAWANAFDTLAHYKARLIERAERAKREAAAMTAAARKIRV